MIHSAKAPLRCVPISYLNRIVTELRRCSSSCVMYSLSARSQPTGLDSAYAAPSYPWPAYSVVPVFFVPRDWDINSSEVQAEAAALRSALAEIRQLYAHALGGNTFVLNDLVVVQANGPKENYGLQWTGGNIYTDGINIRRRLRGKDCGRSCTVADFRLRRTRTRAATSSRSSSRAPAVTPAAVGFGTAGDGGWAILGDWAIDSLQGQVAEGEYWWSGRKLAARCCRARARATLSTLPHPDAWGGSDDRMIMGYWWGYPDIGFADWEKDRAQPAQDQILLAMPAARAARSSRRPTSFISSACCLRSEATHIRCTSTSMDGSPARRSPAPPLRIKSCSIRIWRSSIWVLAAATRRRPLR